MLQVLERLQGSGRGNFYSAYAIVTAPVIWSTAAATGGPLLYNGSTAATGAGKVNAFILAMSFGISTASTVSGAIGLSTGTTTAPGSTTTIDATGNLSVGGQASGCTAYRIGTVSAAATNFFPVGLVHTGAVTTDTTDDNWIELGGGIMVPPGAFCSVSGSATLTTAVMQIGLIWTEVPV